MVFSLMAETRVLKQLTDGDRTTSDGKLFHNVTVAGKELNRYAYIYSHSWDEERNFQLLLGRGLLLRAL